MASTRPTVVRVAAASTRGGVTYIRPTVRFITVSVRSLRSRARTTTECPGEEPRVATEVCEPGLQAASNATAKFFRPARNQIAFRPMSHPLLRRPLRPCGLERSLAPTPGIHLVRGETTEAWLFERGTARITVEASDATSRRFFPSGFEVAEVATRVSWKLVFRRLG